jgi:hypothetical protein
MPFVAPPPFACDVVSAAELFTNLSNKLEFREHGSGSWIFVHTFCFLIDFDEIWYDLHVMPTDGCHLCHPPVQWKSHIT